MIRKQPSMRFDPTPDGSPAEEADSLALRNADMSSTGGTLNVEDVTRLLAEADFMRGELNASDHETEIMDPKVELERILLSIGKGKPTVRAVHRRRKPAKIVRPPGSFLLGVTSFVYSKKTFERVFQQAIADMREEYNEAILANKKWRARFIVVRGNFSVISAASLHLPVSIVRIVTTFWKVGS